MWGADGLPLVGEMTEINPSSWRMQQRRVPNHRRDNHMKNSAQRSPRNNRRGGASKLSRAQQQQAARAAAAMGGQQGSLSARQRRVLEQAQLTRSSNYVPPAQTERLAQRAAKRQADDHGYSFASPAGARAAHLKAANSQRSAMVMDRDRKFVTTPAEPKSDLRAGGLGIGRYFSRQPTGVERPVELLGGEVFESAKLANHGAGQRRKERLEAKQMGQEAVQAVSGADPFWWLRRGAPV